LLAAAKGLGTCPIGLITAYAADITAVLSSKYPGGQGIVLGVLLLAMLIGRPRKTSSKSAGCRNKRFCTGTNKNDRERFHFAM